MAKIGLTNCRK